MTMGSANKNEWLRQHSIVFAIACDMRGKQEWDEKYSKNSFNSLLKLPAKVELRLIRGIGDDGLEFE